MELEIYIVIFRKWYLINPFYHCVLCWISRILISVLETGNTITGISTDRCIIHKIIIHNQSKNWFMIASTSLSSSKSTIHSFEHLTDFATRTAIILIPSGVGIEFLLMIVHNIHHLHWGIIDYLVWCHRNGHNDQQPTHWVAPRHCKFLAHYTLDSTTTTVGMLIPWATAVADGSWYSPSMTWDMVYYLFLTGINIPDRHSS